MSDRGVITGRWSQLSSSDGGGRITPGNRWSGLRRALAVLRQARLLVDLCRHTVGVWRNGLYIEINGLSPSTVEVANTAKGSHCNRQNAKCQADRQRDYLRIIGGSNRLRARW